MNVRLNREVLCEGCKREEIRKLAGKCGNEEIAKFLYECKLNVEYYDYYIQWISFDEFRNIKCLFKGSFGEVHKATWINHYDYFEGKYNVVLKGTYNSSDKIADILSKVKFSSLMLNVDLILK